MLETATRSKEHETIVQGQKLRKADIMEKASVLDCVFSQENEQNNDTDMSMPPLVHVRALFFSSLSSFSLLPSSLLSPFILFSLSFSVSLSLSPCDVAFGVCLCVLGEEGAPCVRSKRPLSLDSKRLRVYRHHAHMCFNMSAWCRHTRRRFESRHGGFQRPTPHHDHTTTTTTTTTTATYKRVMVTLAVSPRLF